MIKLTKQVESLERAYDRIEAKLLTEENEDEIEVLTEEQFDIEMALMDLRRYA